MYCTKFLMPFFKSLSTLQFMDEEEISLNCTKCTLVSFSGPAVSLFSSSTGLYWMYKRHWYHWLGCLSSIPLQDKKGGHECFSPHAQQHHHSNSYFFKKEFGLVFTLAYFPLFFLGAEQKGNWLYCSEPDWMTRLNVSVSILPLLPVFLSFYS